MIVSDRLRFVFIHVPKCAGTSVRTSIAQFHDSDPRYLKAIVNHPVYGMIDYRHMPLSLIAAVAPEIIDKLRVYASYAIIRDPLQRFQSSMAQRAKMYLGKEFAQMSSDEISNEIDRVIAYLRSTKQISSPDFIHFSRQSEFIFLDGERLVQCIYPVERLDLLAAAIGDRVGQGTVAIGHDNRTTLFRYPQAKRFAMIGRNLSRRLMPETLHDKVRRSARRVLMKPKDQLVLPEFKSDRVVDFIQSHYASDFEVYRMALSETEAKLATG
jgi:hypothetical protein